MKLSLPPLGSKGDASEKEHLLKVYKQTGVLPKPLAELPECPDELKYVWGYYCEVQNHNPLTYCELEAWSRLTDKNLTADEALLLIQTDRAYSKIINGRSRDISNSGKK